jgi:hypothetical protein
MTNNAHRPIVITRHAALVELLRERHPDLVENADIVAHATPELVAGRRVIGVLPLHLAALARTVTEIPLALAPEDRGVELGIDRLREVAGAPRTYAVRTPEELYQGGYSV